MLSRLELSGWLRENNLFYEFAGVKDFSPGSEIFVVDLRQPLDPRVDFSLQVRVIRIERIRDDGMVYYRHHPDGKEECFVPMRNFLVHETIVVLRHRKSAEVVSLKTAP